VSERVRSTKILDGFDASGKRARGYGRRTPFRKDATKAKAMGSFKNQGRLGEGG